MTTYNEQVAINNAKLDKQSDFAEWLDMQNSIPGYQEVLLNILVDAGFGDDTANLVSQTLAHPVAFGMSRRFERGQQAGIHSTKQSIANKLGLGTLK